MNTLSPDQFRERLRSALGPGPDAPRVGPPLRLAPDLSYGRHRGPAPVNARPAAVIALLYPHDGQWFLPFTLRPAHMAEHAGQVSLPGGAVEPGETCEQGALRELAEELAATVAPDQLAGRLSPVYVYSSFFAVQPLVAVVAERPPFVPHPHEVAVLLEMPLPYLLDESHWGWHFHARPGLTYRVPHIAFQGQRIWGATAVILSELIPLLDHVCQGP